MILHNKYYEILKQYLGDYKSELYGRELIGKVKMSQKGIALALEELEGMHILKSRKEGSLKHYGLNLGNTEAKDILAITEIMKKVEFMSKHRKLAYIFKRDDRIVGIFGSYAIGKEKPDSDLDIFIVGEDRKDDYDKQSRLLDVEVSIKYFSPKLWQQMLKEKDFLANEIVAKHVTLFETESFVNQCWSDYFGIS